MGTQSNIGGFNVVLLSVHARYCSYGANLCSFSNRVSTLIQKNRENDGASAPFFFSSGLGFGPRDLGRANANIPRTIYPHRQKSAPPKNPNNFYPYFFPVFFSENPEQLF